MCWGIHLQYLLLTLIQILGGLVQSSGWPSVVTIMANWFGKGKKGLIFGIWNSHTSVGNIIGSLLAGAFVEDSWGLSFIVPGLIMTILGAIFFFIMVPKPEMVDLDIEELVRHNISFYYLVLGGILSS